MSQNSILEQVEYCLENFPRTRNSDTILIVQVWNTFYKEVLDRMQRQISLGSKRSTAQLIFEALSDLPKAITIVRYRCAIQYGSPLTGYPGRFKADEQIEKERIQLSEKTQNDLGYIKEKNKMVGEYLTQANILKT